MKTSLLALMIGMQMLDTFATELVSTSELVNISSSTNTLLQTPDISTWYRLESGDEVLIKAFRTQRTHALLNKPAVLTAAEIRTLTWVSAGISRFVIERLNERQIDHVEVSILYLDDSIRTALAEKITEKYSITIQKDQIQPLEFSKYVCKTKIANISGHLTTVRGEVKSFQRNPLKLIIDAPKGSIERRALLHQFNANISIDFYCDTFADGTFQQKQAFQIDFSKPPYSEYVEKLMGESDRRFLSRAQLAELARDIYRGLNIEEEYDISELRFSKQFIEEFIEFASMEGFRSEPIKTALESLSTYAIDLSHDFSSDTIIGDLSSLYVVNDISNEKHVAVNTEALTCLSRKYVILPSQVPSEQCLQLFSASEKSSCGNGTSQSDADIILAKELSKLNHIIANQVTFEIQGKQVIPKSWTVAKITKSKLRHRLSVPRVRKDLYNAPYHERVHLVLTKEEDVKLSSKMAEIEEKISMELSMFRNELRDLALRLQNENDIRLNISDESIEELRKDVHRLRTSTQAMSSILKSTSFVSKCRICHCQHSCTDINRYSCGEWTTTETAGKSSVQNTRFNNNEFTKLECELRSIDIP